MPFESEAQRRFMYAKHPKLAKEFQEATPKEADLPEHVKKEKHMADGGIAENADTNSIKPSEKMPDMETNPEAFEKEMGHDNVKHDSDAVRSYLSSKFHNLLHPTEEAPKMAEGGYPHVTFLENVSFPEVKKTVHLDEKAPENAHRASIGHEENYADGGVTINVNPDGAHPMDPLVAKGLPGVPALPGAQPTVREQAEGTTVPSDEKLAAVLKAMGMEKYAIGGPVMPPQATGPDLGIPASTDPTYWDQIKAALAKISAPVTKPAEAVSGMAANIAPVVAAPAVSALNNLTGASLPVPTAPAPKIEDLGVPKPLGATLPPAMPSMTPQTPNSAIHMGGGAPNDLKSLFNQDTSKLTEGVNAEDRQNLAGKMEEGQKSTGSIVAEALAGLGDALAAKGGREQHALKDIFGLQKQQRDEALANFDKARQDRLDKLDLQTKMGNNTINKLAAQDAYGVDEHLNKMLGAPPGTAHKDLPLYMQMMTAKVGQQEKDTDLYMKAHAQAANEIEGAEKSAGVLHIKPSPAQMQAAGAKLADTYYNRAKGNILFQPSDGQKAVWIPSQNIQKAKQMDPHGQIIP